MTDGTVGSYVYREGYTDVNNNGWTEITHEFTLDADGTYSIVIMNSKNPGGDVLIDDVTLTTGNKQVIKYGAETKPKQGSEPLNDKKRPKYLVGCEILCNFAPQTCRTYLNIQYFKQQ